MDLRQLRNFLAVAEEAHFGRASERVALSQPALSRQIQALEEEVGFRLFDRASKAVRLTEAGRIYEADVRRLVAELDTSARSARDVAQGRAGHLRMGIFGSAILDFIPAVINRFSQVSPQVRLSLHQLDKDMQIDAIRRGQLDLGFNRLVPEEPDIVVERVRSEPLVFVTRSDNPLAREKSVTFDKIREEALVLYPSGVRNSLLHQVQDLYHRHGAKPVVAQEVPDPITAVALIAGGMGSGLMPRAVSRLSLPDICFLPFTDDGRELRINLAVLYLRQHRSAALDALLPIIRAEGAGMK